MNTNRFIWGATAILFAVLGGFAGLALSQLYVKRLVVSGFPVPGPMQTTIISAITVGLVIVLARVGLWIATKFMLPSIANMRRVSAVDRVLGIVGALLGLVFGVLVSIPLFNIDNKLVVAPLQLCVMAICAGVGMAMLQGMRSELLRVLPALDEDATPQSLESQPKILDTNVIIDGRIADLCKTGFIEGPLYVPHFVLEEVQYIADSSDDLRRARGRRGLEVLSQLREMIVTRPAPMPKNPNAPVPPPREEPLVRVINDMPAVVRGQETVDSKLVFLAKELGASIMTNDFNLNRVAGVQGVQVLNINELSQSLKPVVLPSEEMTVTIVKAGKEPGQGVGYLDDGTMIVVSDGAEHVGETRVVTISSVYQTLAGKMIFADLKDKNASSRMRGPGDDLFGEGSHDDQPSRSGSGMRRKGGPRR